jgi:hypothetical protein
MLKWQVDRGLSLARRLGEFRAILRKYDLYPIQAEKMVRMMFGIEEHPLLLRSMLGPYEVSMSDKSLVSRGLVTIVTDQQRGTVLSLTFEGWVIANQLAVEVVKASGFSNQ